MTDSAVPPRPLYRVVTTLFIFLIGDRLGEALHVEFEKNQTDSSYRLGGHWGRDDGRRMWEQRLEWPQPRPPTTILSGSTLTTILVVAIGRPT